MKTNRNSHKRAEKGTKTRCTHCSKEYVASDLGLLSDAILKRKPACSYECNKALGQVNDGQ